MPINTQDKVSIIYSSYCPTISSTNNVSVVVSFTISQVGDDEMAAKFLWSLVNDTEIRDILHCTNGNYCIT